MVILEDFNTIDAVQGKSILLDLLITDLFGFHKSVDELTVMSMIEIIKSGADLPPVKIVTENNQTYHLTFLIDSETGRPDGGHHRAYSYFLSKKLLPCEIVPYQFKAYHTLINIRNMNFRK